MWLKWPNTQITPLPKDVKDLIRGVFQNPKIGEDIFVDFVTSICFCGLPKSDARALPLLQRCFLALVLSTESFHAQQFQAQDVLLHSTKMELAAMDDQRGVRHCHNAWAIMHCRSATNSQPTRKLRPQLHAIVLSLSATIDITIGHYRVQFKWVN